MERLIEYILLHFKLENSIAPVLALIIAIMDNKSKGIKDCIIVSILATGVAGVVQDYLPAHSIWISICIGVSSGVCTDALYERFVNKFPYIVDDILNLMSEGIKAFINKLFGK